MTLDWSQEIQLEFQHEKEAREKAAEKHRVESDKQVELGRISVSN